MGRREDLLAELQRRGIDPNQFDIPKMPFRSTKGIVSEPVPSEEVAMMTEYETRQDKFARYEAIDPRWQTLETPEIARQIETEDLLDIMGRPTIPSLGETKRLFGARTFGEIGGAFDQVGIKRRAYEELMQRDFTQEDILATMPEGERATFVGQLWSDLPQIGAGTAGGIIGGTYGYVRGGPWGAAKYGTAGAAIAGGAGKAIQQQARRLYAPEEVPPTFIGKAKEIGWAATEEGVSEGIGHGLTAGFRGAKRLIGGKTVHRLIHNADELNAIMNRHGSHLLPDQASDDIILDKLGTISEKSFFGGPTIGAVKAYGQPAAIREAGEEVAERVLYSGPTLATKTAGQSAEEVVGRMINEAGEKLTQLEMGTVLLDTLTGGDAVVKKQTQAIYSRLRRITGDLIVDQRPAQQAAQKLLDDVAGAKRLGSAGAIEDFAEKVLQWDEGAQAMAAHANRSFLLEEGRRLETILGSKSPKLTRAISKVDDALYGALEKTFKSHSDEAYNLWRQGADLVKETKQKFNDKVILGLVKKLDTSPDIASATIFKGGKKVVERIKDIVDEPTFNSLKYTLVQQIYTQAEEEATGILRGQKFLSVFKKYERSGALAAAFTPDQIKSIRQIGELAFRTQMKQPGAGGGGMLVQLVQGGALIQLASGKLAEVSPASWTVLIAPLVYARMAANPLTAKWLVKGFGAKQGTKTAIAIGHRLIRIARKEQKAINREEAMKSFRKVPISPTGKLPYQAGAMLRAD